MYKVINRILKIMYVVIIYYLAVYWSLITLIVSQTNNTYLG